MQPLTRNTLFYGDNLPILREYIADESVDLIYLDPPFNSNRNYNVLFKDESGHESSAQITAFDDTWHWDAKAAATLHELITTAPPDVSTMIEALSKIVGRSQMMAYLVMMTARLIELHRVLKPTGSLYLHCDPTASHYLKIVLDTIFGGENFRNEIIWKRTSAHSDAKKKFPNVTDTILFYGRSQHTTFDPQYGKHNRDYQEKFYRFDDNDGRGLYRLDNMSSPNPRPNMMYEWMGFPPPAKGWRYQRETMQKLHDEGRIYYPTTKDGQFDTTKRPALKRYLSEQEGSIITNAWFDIQSLHSSHAERLGYPTQKPLALLERIIQASSNAGDVVLDPFCGCGTATAAAEKLGRRWIGIDITHLAVGLQKNRLLDMFGLKPRIDYDVRGEPTDLGAAQELAASDPYQFQFWAVSLINAQPQGGKAGSKQGKKGADRGIDGVITFSEGRDEYGRVLVQVKGGKNVSVRDIRDLRGTIEREQSAIGVFITLAPPTREMRTEAADAGVYTSQLWQRTFPRLQIVTIEDLLLGQGLDLPPSIDPFKRAPRVQNGSATQNGLGL